MERLEVLAAFMKFETVGLDDNEGKFNICSINKLSDNHHQKTVNLIDGKTDEFIENVVISKLININHVTPFIELKEVKLTPIEKIAICLGKDKINLNDTDTFINAITAINMLKTSYYYVRIETMDVTIYKDDKVIFENECQYTQDELKDSILNAIDVFYRVHHPINDLERQLQNYYISLRLDETPETHFENLKKVYNESLVIESNTVDIASILGRK